MLWRKRFNQKEVVGDTFGVQLKVIFLCPSDNCILLNHLILACLDICRIGLRLFLTSGILDKMFCPCNHVSSRKTPGSEIIFYECLIAFLASKSPRTRPDWLLIHRYVEICIEHERTPFANLFEEVSFDSFTYIHWSFDVVWHALLYCACLGWRQLCRNLKKCQTCYVFIPDLVHKLFITLSK